MSAIDEVRSLISNRIGELDRERGKLHNALRELGSSPVRRTEDATSDTAATQRRKNGSRADQALRQIEESPGSTASEIAQSMNIKPNYVYHVLSALERDGRVKRDGRKYTST